MSILRSMLLVAAAAWMPGCGSGDEGKQPAPSQTGGVKPQPVVPTGKKGMTAEEAAAIALKKAKGQATPDEIARLKKYIEGE